MMTFDDLIQQFREWAEREEDIRAALILGSQARQDHPADEWSDLDLVIYTRHPEKLIRTADWTSTIGPNWLNFVERTGDGSSWERRILFEGGLDVDVSVNPEEWLDEIVRGLPPDVADILRRGVRVLTDKDGKLARIQKLPLPQGSLYRKPTEEEFANSTSDFWYHALWSVKHLRRGELWWAKSGSDMHMKGLLKDMLEWHAHATKGEQFDTWLRGRFLEEWADPRAVRQLRETFGHYDSGDIARSLRATMELYRWLEDETAAAWEYSVPREGEEEATRRTLNLLEIFGQ